MSMLGTKTKKINVYGRKKAAIINVHQDVVSPVKSSPDPVGVTTPVPTTPWKRPPLTSKLSQNTALDSDSSSEDDEKENEKVKSKPIAKAPTKPVFAKSAKPSKPKPKVAKVIPPSSPSDYAPSPARISSSEEEEEDEPASRKTARAPRPRRKAVRPPIRETDDMDELAQRLERAVIGVKPKVPVQSKAAALQAQLCGLCDGHGVQTWSSFLSSAGGKLSKIGEASYSEVFGIANPGEDRSVLKIIPLVGLAVDAPSGDAPDCSTVDEVMRELDITKRMAAVPGGGFVKFIKQVLCLAVVEGEYPEELLEEWDSYKSENGSHSTRPACFTAKQKYCVVELVNHGEDLETFRFSTSNGWIQATGLIMQVVDALARAEKWTNFEHRDLHEGQILLSSTSKSKAKSGDYASPAFSGIQATLIDFGLSRLDIPGRKAVWSQLPEEVFEGKGDQWDVYRKMRELTKDDWEGGHLSTNVLWLQYLVKYLFTKCNLRKPKTALEPAKRLPNKKSSSSQANDDAYAVLIQLRNALDRAVEVASNQAAGKEVRARRGKEEFKFESAQDVAAWCRQMGRME